MTANLADYWVSGGELENPPEIARAAVPNVSSLSVAYSGSPINLDHVSAPEFYTMERPGWDLQFGTSLLIKAPENQ